MHAQWQRADRRFGAAQVLVAIGCAGVQVAHHTRRDQQHDLGLAAVAFLAGEQTAQHGQVDQPGHTRRRLAVFVADQARQRLGFAILQPQRGGRQASADLVGQAA